MKTTKVKRQSVSVLEQVKAEIRNEEIAKRKQQTKRRKDYLKRVHEDYPRVVQLVKELGIRLTAEPDMGLPIRLCSTKFGLRAYAHQKEDLLLKEIVKDYESIKKTK